MKPILFVILDGAADAGPRTPLSEARKPNMDYMASNGFCGLWRGAVAPREYNPKSMSDVATLELLGYSCKDNPGRGYLEALGLGMKPIKNAIYLRGNFATAKKTSDGIEITDRRAGRDSTGLDILAKKICMKIDGFKITCRHSVGHRCVVILEGNGLGTNVTDADSSLRIRDIVSKKSGSEKTAKLLNEFSRKAFEILSKDAINKKRKCPANYILMRGASKARKMTSFEKKFRFHACSISGVGIIWGISKYLGIDYIHPKGTNGHLNTDLKSKISAARKAVKKYDFVIFHINGCDEAGHDKNFNAKKKFLEKIDNEVISELIKWKMPMVITSDHQTSVVDGSHHFGPVPFIMFNPEKNISNGVKKFDEKRCSIGRKENNLIKTLRKKLCD